MMPSKPKTLLICAILYFLVQVTHQTQKCTGTFGGIERTKYCEIGGCCIPQSETGYSDPDDLCCISELTIILVAAFVCGPLLILIAILCTCTIRKYLEKRKKLREQRLTSSNHTRHRRRRRHSTNEDGTENHSNNNLPKPENGYINGAPPLYHGTVSLPGYNEDQLNTAEGSLTLPLSPPPSYAFAIANQDSTTNPNIASTSGGGNQQPTAQANRNNNVTQERHFHRPRQGVTDSPTEELELYNTISIGRRQNQRSIRGYPSPAAPVRNGDTQQEPEQNIGVTSTQTANDIPLTTTSANNTANKSKFHVPRQQVTEAPPDEPDMLLDFSHF